MASVESSGLPGPSGRCFACSVVIGGVWTGSVGQNLRNMELNSVVLVVGDDGSVQSTAGVVGTGTMILRRSWLIVAFRGTVHRRHWPRGSWAYVGDGICSLGVPSCGWREGVSLHR